MGLRCYQCVPVLGSHHHTIPIMLKKRMKIMPTYQELIERLKQAKTVAERAKIKEEIRALKNFTDAYTNNKEEMELLS